jgi:hypothetical protein
MSKEDNMGNVIVIANGRTKQSAIHRVRFDVVDKEPLFIVPLGTPSAELNDMIRAAGHCWPIYDQQMGCKVHGHEFDEITGNCVYCGAYRA